MGKKKDNDRTRTEDAASWPSVVEPPPPQAMPHEPPEPREPPPRRPILPALSVGDILAILALVVLSAALLLEGYHKDFKDYSKEIIALFAIVVGFLLGRKT